MMNLESKLDQNEKHSQFGIQIRYYGKKHSQFGIQIRSYRKIIFNLESKLDHIEKAISNLESKFASCCGYRCFVFLSMKSQACSEAK